MEVDHTILNILKCGHIHKWAKFNKIGAFSKGLLQSN